ncbi:MAG: CYTH domain-containing protein [Nanoarchaeota archaeon]|nr:CYTH domain-containing protein [Nanoarchaeota archaeon]
MDEEKEIKILVTKDAASLKRMLSDFGATHHSSVTQSDVYYDFPDAKLHSIQHGLRIRIEDNKPKNLEFKALFHLPEKQGHPWHVVESSFSFPIKDVKGLNKIFSLLGLPSISEKEISYDDLKIFFKSNDLSASMTINKERVTMKKDDVEFMIDNVDRLGLFLEVETANSRPHEVLEQLGLAGEERFALGYTGLYAKKFLKEDPEDKLKKFKQDPFWNVLPSEREFVETLHKQFHDG